MEDLEQEARIRELFDDWLGAERFYIMERSGSIDADLLLLMERAKYRATNLGIPWSDAQEDELVDLRTRVAGDDLP
jgi:hypothetical protein